MLSPFDGGLARGKNGKRGECHEGAREERAGEAPNGKFYFESGRARGERWAEGKERTCLSSLFSRHSLRDSVFPSLRTTSLRSTGMRSKQQYKSDLSGRDKARICIFFLKSL